MDISETDRDIRRILVFLTLCPGAGRREIRRWAKCTGDISHAITEAVRLGFVLRVKAHRDESRLYATHCGHDWLRHDRWFLLPDEATEDFT